VNQRIERLKAAAQRRLRGPVFSAGLRSLGVDPKRYWLLMDLFHKLGAREEIQGSSDRRKIELRVSAFISFVVSGVIAVAAAWFGAPAWGVIAVALSLTAFVLIPTMLSEAANSLVHPEEGLALAHYPINGATYTSAKLSRLLFIVTHLVLAWNLAPAALTPFMNGGRWWMPALYLAAAFALGILIGLFCCGIFGVLMRFVPPRRMKSAAQLVQALPFVIFMLAGLSGRETVMNIRNWLSEHARFAAAIPPWLFVAAALASAGAATIFGVRSLSADYLIRASSMVHGRADVRTRRRRPFLGLVVRAAFGGQASRAGFDYTRRMMARDWQFRRQLLELLPLAFPLAAAFGAVEASPFSASFSSAHIMPHALGFIVYMICLLAAFGTDYRGVWLFQLVSKSGLSRFARGVHAAFWMTLVIAPHALLLPVFAWLWGASDAASFALYSATVTTMYLAAGLRRIHGVPFGKQVNPVRPAAASLGIVGLAAFAITALIAVGIQYVVFRSRLLVHATTLLAGLAAFLWTRSSLGAFELQVRHHLGTLDGTSTMIYTEVET